jgi:hypothetical protein
MDGDMVGQQRVSDHSFFQPEVFGRIAGIDRGRSGFEPLAIAAGVEHAIDIVMPEDGQGGDRIAHPIVGPAERFQTDKVFRRRGQRLIADIGGFPHPAEPHVGRPGNETGREDAIVRVLFGVSSQDVLEGCQEVAVPMDEMQYAADVYLGEAIEHRMVDRFTATGIAQSPADLPAASGDLEVLVVARGDALINLSEPGFQTRFECSQVLPDGLVEDGETRVRHEFSLLLPSLVVQQIILETPEADAIAAENIASFETVA